MIVLSSLFLSSSLPLSLFLSPIFRADHNDTLERACIEITQMSHPLLLLRNAALREILSNVMSQDTISNTYFYHTHSLFLLVN